MIPINLYPSHSILMKKLSPCNQQHHLFGHCHHLSGEILGPFLPSVLLIESILLVWRRRVRNHQESMLFEQRIVHEAIREEINNSYTSTDLPLGCRDNAHMSLR